jgi:hypothetical protein
MAICHLGNAPSLLCRRKEKAKGATKFIDENAEDMSSGPYRPVYAGAEVSLYAEQACLRIELRWRK